MAEGVLMVLTSAIDESELQCVRWRQVARSSMELNELASVAHDQEQIRMRRMRATRENLIRLLEETTAERKQAAGRRRR